MPGSTVLAALLLAASPLVRPARAFSFRHTAPTQCGQWTVEWDGGTAPFHLVIVPTMAQDSGRIINMTVPATGSPPYQHTFQLPEPAGLEMVATMYDANGFGSGGATDLLTVGNSTDTSCLDSNVVADFYFWIQPTSAPPQCGNLAVTWNGNAQAPVGLHGIVIGGTAWDIPVTSQATDELTLDWHVNLAAGTEFLLLMSDAGTYGTGGSTVILTVGDSSDATCVNSSSPHSTSVPPLLSTASSTASVPSQTKTSNPTGSTSNPAGSSSGNTDSTTASGAQQSHTKGSTSTHSPSGPASSSASGAAAAGAGSGKNTSTVIGAVVGAFAAVIAALILAFCLIRRRRRQKQQDHDYAPMPDPYMTDRMQAEDSPGVRQALLRRFTVAGGRQPHARISSFAGGVPEGRITSGVVAGLPHGAAPPSLYTNDSRTEMYELSPFPYEEPPAFQSLGYTRRSNDTKTPLSSGTPETRTTNPFADDAQSSHRASYASADTLVVPGAIEKDAQGSSDYSSPPTSNNQPPSHLSHLSAHDAALLAPPTGLLLDPGVRTPGGATGDNHSDRAWRAATHDPPPQYNVYDRLEVANPDPSEAGSSTFGHSRQSHQSL